MGITLINLLMKRIWKIVLIIVAVILIAVGYFGYEIYLHVAGSESLGESSAIPEYSDKHPPINTFEHDWPNWRGPALNGKSSLVSIKADWSDSLTKLWTVDFLCQDNRTATWSSVVVQGNRLIVPGRDEDHDLLFCLNSKTGELIWENKYAAETNSSHGPGPRATPVINEDYVYTFGRSGDVACWKLFDGELVWHKKTTDIGGKEPNWGYSATPFVYKNLLIIQGGGTNTIQAYNKYSGDVVWTALEGPAGFSAANLIKLEGQNYLVIYHGKGLSLIHPDDGNVLWTVPYETSYGVNATTPLVLGDKILHASGYDMGAQLVKAGVDNYEILWANNEYQPQHSDPIEVNGYLYGYSGESGRPKGDFLCIEIASGEIKWSTKELGQGTTIFAGGYLITLDLKGNLSLLKPNPNKYEKVGEVKAAIPNVRHLAWTVPVVANGKLYLRYLQHLICYDISI